MTVNNNCSGWLFKIDGPRSHCTCTSG